ncbi:YeeE/YedE family protein [Vibrio intestinalis]|uniref:YeeE/YedE family protein n=1 Tax=Vibrio intestinalis TaxID=2933291 RepID=UPI0021A5D046|nr:YeeE/YedE family protein [Vibrio intestinalis]
MKQTSKVLWFYLAALCAGGLFGAGMVISGMANPEKVIGFLDISGDWDASLMFVMGGALFVFMPSYHWLIKSRAQAVSGCELSVPTRTDIDAKLLIGASLFGVGWGMLGVCPGPAVASIALGNSDIWLFIVAMSLGLTLPQWPLFKAIKVKSA